MDTRVGVNENPLGRESLGAMAGDSVTVIEVAMLDGSELDWAVIVQTGANAYTFKATGNPNLSKTKPNPATV